MNPIFEELKLNKPFLFDGAMGTYFASFPGRSEMRCEQANEYHPDEIERIHTEYLEKGCRAVKTNTFSLCSDIAEGNEEYAFRLIDAGCGIAKKAAEGYGAHVFGDMGPLFEGETEEPGRIYCKAIDRFLENGIKNILIETLSDSSGIETAAKHLKSKEPDAFLMISFAVGADGMTRTGHFGKGLLQEVSEIEEVDSVGLNCLNGPVLMIRYVRSLNIKGLKLFSVMPNAGYPRVVGRHAVFQSDPRYYTHQLSQIAALGVKILGGCCGTTPAHFANVAYELENIETEFVREDETPSEAKRNSGVNRVWEKLEAGERIIAVELDPPESDVVELFMDDVGVLKDAGVDLLTIADCPVGRPRADSSILACKVRRETGLEPLPHMTCRDRNLYAIKALLLGLSMEKIHNVLIITGDPISTENRDEVKAVFNFNSRKLASYISTLNKEVLSTPFRIFAALNVNAANFDVQLQLAKEKEANGISGFLTQPVLSHQAVENLKKARGVLKGKILGGIYPVISYRNASFMNNEVPGVRVSDEIIAMYEGKTKEEAEDVAAELSAKIAKEIAPYTDGFYLMTPFRRVKLMTRIISELKKL